MKYFFKIGFSILLLVNITSCEEYLDIVPDNVATLDHAFKMRTTAERYLFTCYSFLPQLASAEHNPGFMGGDEVTMSRINKYNSRKIGLGEQNTNDPLNNYWEGRNSAKSLWQGISQCNIFLENIGKVPDMEEEEIRKWEAEVKVLKAYYYFFLLRMYGAIPLIKENIPASASVDEVRVSQQPVDSVFNYIVELLDESQTDLPLQIENRYDELGRITLPIALGIKAKVLVYAASPLFNGNTDYVDFKNVDGVQIFNQSFDENKWKLAKDACQEAIEIAESVGYELYEFIPPHSARNISDETKLQMNYRGTITEKWNPEIIWANTNNTTNELQRTSTPRALDASMVGWQYFSGQLGPPFNVVDLFYTKNGLPLDQDISWSYNSRFELRTATADDKYKIKEGYTTVGLHFDRESRFYGGIGFDGGIWYGNGKYDDNNPYWLENKLGQYNSNLDPGWHSLTGYYIKKLVNYENIHVSFDQYTVVKYPWVMLRLGDLYLLYAEALNEVEGPVEEALDYLNLIREKAGLPSVQNSWDNFSKHPGKYKTKEGLREIIHRERRIELAFEGQSFWDLRRWKEAPAVFNQPISGWDIAQGTNEGYYRKRIIHNQSFSFRDYFWPIRENELIRNMNLVQTPGW